MYLITFFFFHNFDKQGKTSRNYNAKASSNIFRTLDHENKTNGRVKTLNYLIVFCCHVSQQEILQDNIKKKCSHVEEHSFHVATKSFKN